MTTYFKKKTEEPSYSKPSSPVVSMNLPKVKDLNSEFVYNYYVSDERTNENPIIPDYLKKKSIDQNASEVLDFSLRVPRYVKLSWEIPAGVLATPLLQGNSKTSIQSNLDKIQTEESFLKSRYSGHSISNHDAITDANVEINSIAGDVLNAYSLNPAGAELKRDGFKSSLNNRSRASAATAQETSFINTLNGKPKFVRLTKEHKKVIKNNFPNSIINVEKQAKYQLLDSKKTGFSPFSVIDKFNINSLKNVANKLKQSKSLKNDIKSSVGNTEDLGTNHLNNSGITFYDNKNKPIVTPCGYEAIVETAIKNPLTIQVNKLAAVDVFASSSIASQDFQKLNKNFSKSLNGVNELDDVFSQPVYIGDTLQTPDSYKNAVGLVGYLVERSVLTQQGFVKDKTYTVENPYINNFVDSSVLFGKAYHYSIRTVLRVLSTGFDEGVDEIREIAYYIASKPSETTIKTFEYVPPPTPIDIGFVWDYKDKNLQITWDMPVNPQRDITQFQIFRRESIEEPFQLIRQKCFDLSTLKYTTGEIVDGNKNDQSSILSQYVDYSDTPIMFHIDDDFIVNSESQTSSKYIYAIVAIDAHGMTSNYSAQFEVTFDFFKNVLIKKLISSSGAPKPYPNLYVKIDAFKDVIKTSGMNSTKLKVYFMPEYFKIQYKDQRIQKMLSTKQDGSYYKIQFINLQNQKSDSLKITVDDPHELTK